MKKKQKSGQNRRKRKPVKEQNRKQSRQRTKPGSQRKGREQARAQAPVLPPNREAIPEKAGERVLERKVPPRGRQRKRRFLHRSPFPIRRWDATGSAACRTVSTPKRSVSMTSIISLLRTRTRARSLRTGATSSIILTAPSISSCLSSTTNQILQSLRT